MRKEAANRNLLTAAGAGLGAILGGTLGYSISKDNLITLISALGGGTLGGYGGFKLADKLNEVKYSRKGLPQKKYTMPQGTYPAPEVSSTGKQEFGINRGIPVKIPATSPGGKFIPGNSVHMSPEERIEDGRLGAAKIKKVDPEIQRIHTQLEGPAKKYPVNANGDKLGKVSPGYTSGKQEFGINRGRPVGVVNPVPSGKFIPGNAVRSPLEASRQGSTGINPFVFGKVPPESMPSNIRLETGGPTPSKKYPMSLGNYPAPKVSSTGKQEFGINRGRPVGVVNPIPSGKFIPGNAVRMSPEEQIKEKLLEAAKIKKVDPESFGAGVSQLPTEKYTIHPNRDKLGKVSPGFMSGPQEFGINRGRPVGVPATSPGGKFIPGNAVRMSPPGESSIKENELARLSNKDLKIPGYKPPSIPDINIETAKKDEYNKFTALRKKLIDKHVNDYGNRLREVYTPLLKEREEKILVESKAFHIKFWTKKFEEDDIESKTKGKKPFYKPEDRKRILEKFEYSDDELPKIQKQIDALVDKNKKILAEDLNRHLPNSYESMINSFKNRRFVNELTKNIPNKVTGDKPAGSKAYFDADRSLRKFVDKKVGKGGDLFSYADLAALKYGSKEEFLNTVEKAKEYRKNHPEIDFLQNLDPRSLNYKHRMSFPKTHYVSQGRKQKWDGSTGGIPALGVFDSQLSLHPEQSYDPNTLREMIQKGHIQINPKERYTEGDLLDTILHELFHGTQSGMVLKPGVGSFADVDDIEFINNLFSYRDEGRNGLSRRISDDIGNKKSIYTTKPSEREVRISDLKAYLTREKRIRLGEEHVGEKGIKILEDLFNTIETGKKSGGIYGGSSDLSDIYHKIKDPKLKREFLMDILKRAPGLANNNKRSRFSNVA